ncbi:MAG: glucosyltransferase domain-containing protein [Neisseriaceae bacterium]|nr:glucosyltransferase domain-containing protein [Neisseriaceae bacterium]
MKLQWNKQYNDAVLIALVVIFPIVLIGEPFADDFNRMAGVRDYSLDGRYLTNVVFRFLSQDNFLFNLAPLPQIMGIVIYSITLMFIVRKIEIFNRLQSGLLLFIALTTPYMLAVYPYNYDALSICIAMSIFSLTPFIFNTDKLNYKYKQMYISLFYKIIIIVVAFLLYQPVLPTFIIFSLFLYINDIDNNKNKNLIFNTFAIVFSYFIYNKIVLNLFDDAYWYKTQSSVDITLIPVNIFENLIPFTLFVFERYIGLILIPLFFIIYFSIYAVIVKNSTQENTSKFKRMLIIPIMLFLTIIFLSIISPRPENLHLRLVVSISSALFCLSVIGFKYLKGKIKIYVHSIATALVILFSFADLCIFSYAFKLQKEYERMLITTLYDGFNYIDNNLNNGQTKNKMNIFFVCKNDCLNPYSIKLINNKLYMADLLYNKTIFNFYTGMNSYLHSYSIQESVDKLSHGMSNTFLTEDKKVFNHYLYDIYYFKNSQEIYIIIK